MPIDYKKYPPGWKKEIVPRILKRANNKCELCGLENKSFAFSVPVYAKNQKGRYGYFQIWVTDEGSVLRLAPLKSGETKKVYIVLTVAHLDHDETNWDVKDDRLKAMCQKCHLQYDAEEKYRRTCE